MTVLVKAIYKQGIFEPVVPIEDLAENEEVQLQVFSVTKNAFTEEDKTWENDFFKDDEEWEKMSIWEQRGIQRPDLSQEEIDARVKSIMNSSGSIKLEGDLGLEIAMSEY